MMLIILKTTGEQDEITIKRPDLDKTEATVQHHGVAAITSRSFERMRRRKKGEREKYLLSESRHDALKTWG